MRRSAELLAGLGHHLEPELDRVVAHLLDALHLQGLEHVRGDLGIGRELLADLLDELAHLVEVGVVGDADRHLVDDPVTRLVLHGAELAERHGRQRAAMMAQLHGAQREALHRALVARRLDVLADPEGIVEQVEDARDDVLDERLGAEPDGDADDAGAGEQRADLDAERVQDHQGETTSSITSRKLRSMGSSVLRRWRRRACGLSS